MELLPESTRLLYAQLLSECLHGAAPSGRGLSFVSKRIKGGTHWYLQLTVGSRKSQHYLGPDTDEIRSVIGKEWPEMGVREMGVREQLVLFGINLHPRAYSIVGFLWSRRLLLKKSSAWHRVLFDLPRISMGGSTPGRVTGRWIRCACRYGARSDDQDRS